MRVTLTGATGLVGANLAAALLEQGHTVRATKRSSSRTDHLADLDIEWTTAPLSDLDGLTAAFEGADAVFHCAAAVSIKAEVTPMLQSANIDGTKNVLEAVRKARVARLIHCSSTVAVGLSTDGSDCTEDAPWNFADFGLADGYATTKKQSEELVWAAKDIDAVAVCPGFMFGPYDVRPSSGGMILEVCRNAVPGYSSGVNNFVDVRDVVDGMILAWEKGKRGERYILGGENLTYGEVFARISAVAGTKPITMGVPKWIATVPALWGDLTEMVTGKEPLLNSNSVNWGYAPGFRFSSEKARRELGYTTRPLDEGISSAITWFREHDMVGPLPRFP
ncbi:MAG: NAD-dependent epimerase/dehydratase family protein [Proteobacteria bacterium]|nr:NAD-dependent epimerase/dehydratase family protein [Pseudomonadota bacterium]MCP4921045.1 NAD-dependent epimerase/dehydratase family protein [Pseudomonadota bacterium]